MTLTRREFVEAAAALGASLAWGGNAEVSRMKWQERRDLYPEGVASNSLIGYRAFRYGRHLDLIITDQHSYRSADAFKPAALSIERRELAPVTLYGRY